MVESTSAKQILDKTIFAKHEKITCVRTPVNKIQLVQRKFRDYIMIRPKLRACHAIDGVDGFKHLYM